MRGKAPGRTAVGPWEEFFAERGLKSTVSRRAILTALFRSRGHVSLMDIQQTAREDAPHVGLATVYRTMKLLEDAGFVRRHEFRGEASRYEPALGRARHDHFICQSCDAVIEFENVDFERLEDEIARSHGFEVSARRLELYGYCRACRAPTS